MTTHALTEREGEAREGFFYALAIDLWPNLRKHNPVAFDRNVQLLFDYSLQTKQGSSPLNPKHYPNDSHYNADVLHRAERWITGPKQTGTKLGSALESGKTNKAASLLGVTYIEHSLPVQLKGGYLNPAVHNPGWFQRGINAEKHFWGGSVPHAAHDVGSGVVDAGKGVLDVGGWLKDNLLIVVLIVVLILIVKK